MLAPRPSASKGSAAGSDRRFAIDLVCRHAGGLAIRVVGCTGELVAGAVGARKAAEFDPLSAAQRGALGLPDPGNVRTCLPPKD
jgi:hypothetical protein